MLTPNQTSRSAFFLAGLLGLVALASLTPAAAEGKLTKPERRAVDISGVTGASTSTAMLAEIRFAGNLGDRLGRGALRRAQVKIDLLTASGQATVIRDRGTRPRPTRSGTVGSFELIRRDRSLLLLAEGLSEPIRQITVSTGTGAAVAARDGSVIFDQSTASIEWINAQEAQRLERERVEREIKSTERQVETYDKVIEILRESVDDWHRRWMDAESKTEREVARERLEGERRTLRNVTEEQGERRKRLIVLRRWLEIVKGIRIIVVIPLQ